MITVYYKKTTVYIGSIIIIVFLSNGKKNMAHQMYNAFLI